MLKKALITLLVVTIGVVLWIYIDVQDENKRIQNNIDSLNTKPIIEKENIDTSNLLYSSEDLFGGIQIPKVDNLKIKVTSEGFSSPNVLELTFGDDRMIITTIPTVGNSVTANSKINQNWYKLTIDDSFLLYSLSLRPYLYYQPTSFTSFDPELIEQSQPKQKFYIYTNSKETVFDELINMIQFENISETN